MSWQLSDSRDQLGAESTALKERVDTLATRLENVPELVSEVEDHTQLLQDKALILHTYVLHPQIIRSGFLLFHQ